MAPSHKTFAIVLVVAAVLLSGMAHAANVAVANVNALDLARRLVNSANLQLITTGSLAPKFTGHSKSAGIVTWDTTNPTAWMKCCHPSYVMSGAESFSTQYNLVLTTGRNVADAVNPAYDVNRDAAPSTTDITNTAIPNSHDAVVLDFSVQVTAASGYLNWAGYIFQTTEKLPFVVAKHATGVKADDTAHLEINNTRIAWMNVTYLDYVNYELFPNPQPNWADSWSLLHLGAKQAYMRSFNVYTWPAVVSRGTIFRMKIRLADVGDRLGESYLFLRTPGLSVDPQPAPQEGSPQ